MLLDFHLGQTSVTFRCKIKRLDTGQGLTGLTGSSTGLVIGTIASNEAATTTYTAGAAHIQTIPTLGTYSAPAANSCRFAEVDATNHPGTYEVQIADARFAVASSKFLQVTLSGVANMAECDVLIPLRTVDPYATNFGITGAIGAVTGAVGSVTGAVGSVTGAVGSVTAAVSLAAGVSDVIFTGTATAGGASTVTLPAGASAIDGTYNGEEIQILSGTGAGQLRGIATPGYVGSTKVVTVTLAWTTTPDATSVVVIRSIPAAGAGGSTLGSSGLDSIVVETGVNARQALSIILASASGVLSGATGAVVTIAGGNSGPTRIVANVDGSGNRTSVALSPPA